MVEPQKFPNMQKTLSWIAFVGGEIILYVAFRIWGGALPDEIRILDTVVSMLILALFFADLLIPWVDWNGGSHKRFGSLGIRWAFTWLYALAAVAAMVVCQSLFHVEFLSQLMVQIILILGLVLGFSASVGASSKVESVHHLERSLLDGPREMMRQARHLQEVAEESGNIPKEYRNRIGQLVEELRFVAPSPAAEASDLEAQFAEALRTIEFALPACDMNRETIAKALSRAERLCSQRKAIHTTN